MQAVVNGLLMGSVYGIIALSLSLIFGIVKICNFGHGQTLMVGMYIGFCLWKFLGINVYYCLPITMIIMYFVGVGIQNYMVNPILKREKDRGPLSVLLLTVGLMMVQENLALLIFGPNYRSVTMSITGKTLNLGGVLVSLPKLVAFGSSMVATYLLYALLTYTDIGKMIRATSQDREAARLMGINDYKMYNIAFGITGALLAVAATLLLPFYYTYPTLGTAFSTRSFVIVILGGVGSIPGALLGGIIIGLIESVGAQFMTATITEALIFLVFLIILLFKPYGLFGIKGEG